METLPTALKQTRLGWMWKEGIRVRRNSKIPDEMVLSKNDCLEIWPHLKDGLELDAMYGIDGAQKEIEHMIAHHNSWCRESGICLFYKKEGKWFTNYP